MIQKHDDQDALKSTKWAKPNTVKHQQKEAIPFCSIQQVPIEGRTRFHSPSASKVIKQSSSVHQ